MNDVLMHVGTKRHSGRYPYGSGENPFQHEPNFLSRYEKMKSEGMSDDDICKGLGVSKNDLFLTRYNSYHALNLSDKEMADKFGISINEMRNRRNIARTERDDYIQSRIAILKSQGKSNVEIGKELDMNEGTVRLYLQRAKEESRNQAKATADILMKNVDEKGYIDIGSGVDMEIGVNRTKFETAILMAQDKGYVVIKDEVDQLTQKGQKTTIKVLAPEGTTWADVHYNLDRIHSIKEYSKDGGSTFTPVHFPESIDSKRVFIRYNEDGGVDKDGVVELRRGVDDISLGNSSYAQVRIAVDGSHYMKGMAIYSDDIPEGYDIIYNTNKTRGTDKYKVFKEMKIDKSTGEVDRDNPFGALIKEGPSGQHFYKDDKGAFIKTINGFEKVGADISPEKEHYSLSVVNKLKAEGDWNKYSKNLASQMLSKQKKQLVDQQLKLTYQDKKTEFDTIMALTNPVIKKKLLISFADGCAENAESLKAMALPRQSSKVILPITSLKDNEIYAPTYKDGEHVVCIRYPHGGTFEIPELVVNNRNKEGIAVLGKQTIDAVGININVAGRLSGADFDGDTVVVIPVNDRVKITTSKPLFDSFDPSSAYPGYPGMKVMTDKQKGLEMGKASNLITDMTLKGAKPEELERAVKYSMVVIDAVKHKLNYKQAEEDYRIDELKRIYQKQENGKYGGASTLISKASSTQNVDERKRSRYDSPKNINPETGEKIHEYTGRTYVDKNGKTVKALTESTKMAEAKDAFILSSGTPIETSYANFANNLKYLENSARKYALSVGKLEVSASAKETYSKEIKSLEDKLNIALLNAPKERQAQIIATTQVRAKLKANPEIKEDKDQVKKLKQQALSSARAQVGANKKSVQVDISDREWEAIQAGAISTSMLNSILNNTDLDKIKELATPRDVTKLNTSQINRIKNMANLGYNLSEIAESCGVSPSTVDKYLKGDE